MTSSDETAALAASLVPDVQAVLVRIAALKADLDALAAVARNLASAAEDTWSAPTTGTLGATVVVGPAQESA